MKIIIGLLMVVAGFFLIWKTEAIYQFTGANAWAEKHLGTEGGTRILYKLIGLVVIFLGFLTMTGLIGGFIVWLFGPILRPWRSL